MLASRCSAVTLGVSAGRYLRMSFTFTTRVSGIGLSEQSSHRPCTAPLALPAVSSQIGKPGPSAEVTARNSPTLSPSSCASFILLWLLTQSDVCSPQHYLKRHQEPQ